MRMAVTEEQMATLRAQLEGDLEEHRRLLAQLDRAAAGTGYSALLSAAFCVAVERRFAKGTPAADVIEFVGDVRSRFDELANKIDPRTAERLILAVYTDEHVPDELDLETRFRTQLLLLGALIADENLDDAGLDEFLAHARKLADQWLA